MRTIKFRGKNNGQWWYAEYKSDGDMGEWEQFWALVNGKTVGQFIGVVDRHDQQIYEGDILKLESSYHKTYEVYWNDDRWGLRHGKLNDYDSGDYYRGDDINNWHEFEIVGNIHESPSLI